MPEQARALHQLLQTFPEQRQHLLAQLGRIQALASECGCAMGAIFALAAIALLAGWAIRVDGFSVGRWLLVTPAAAAFVLLSGATGKLLGIGVARLRLAALNRRLRLHCERGR